MKKIIIVGLLALVAQFSFAQTISGSSHDFSTWTATGEICVPCHTPHNALAVVDAPLWNHVVTTQSFSPYTGPTGTMNAATGQPAGVSKLCLSCHDGITAADAYGAVPGSSALIGTAVFGTDLTNDHPISFTYNTALATADGELFDPTTTVALGGFIQTKMLFANQMECASCHDVHNKAVAGTKMLHIANTGSALCLTCHNK